MRYLLLLYDDTDATELSAAERRRIVDEHLAYAAMLRERGALVFSGPLDDAATARTIRFDDGRPTVTDGPFLEAKEALGGFYILQCGSEAEALALAAQVPRSPGLIAELRPVPDM